MEWLRVYWVVFILKILVIAHRCLLAVFLDSCMDQKPKAELKIEGKINNRGRKEATKSKKIQSLGNPAPLM